MLQIVSLQGNAQFSSLTVVMLESEWNEIDIAD